MNLVFEGSVTHEGQVHNLARSCSSGVLYRVSSVTAAPLPGSPMEVDNKNLSLPPVPVIKLLAAKLNPDPVLRSDRVDAVFIRLLSPRKAGSLVLAEVGGNYYRALLSTLPHNLPPSGSPILVDYRYMESLDGLQ